MNNVHQPSLARIRAALASVSESIEQGRLSEGASEVGSIELKDLVSASPNLRIGLGVLFVELDSGGAADALVILDQCLGELDAEESPTPPGAEIPGP